MARDRRYPTKAVIIRALDALTEAGVKVGGCVLAPDGSVQILSEANAPRQSMSAFDEWKAKRAKQA